MTILIDFPSLGPPKFFTNPDTIFSTRNPAELPDLLDQVQAACRQGWWAVGWVAFEAAAAFDLPVHPPLADWPLAWFALFRGPSFFPFATPPSLPAHFSVPEISRQRYMRDLEDILERILAGETYQVNYTFSCRLDPQPVDPFSLFLLLTRRHRFPYAAWMEVEEWAVASFSPEMFLQSRHNRLITAPVKGTRARFGGLDAQMASRTALFASEKERAEHVMIVDMSRNDLGRICKPGSVCAPHLFEVRRHSTLFHLETRVQGVLEQPDLPLSAVFGALFPAASITGAPKHRAMSILRQREGQARGVYTGAMGVVQPGGDFLFNVAIRTLTRGGDGIWRMGVGGGIVADSDPEGEWREAADKGSFLHQLPPPYALMETLALPRGDVAAHLARMEASARALAFPFSREKARACLNREWDSPSVLRLTLDEMGEFQGTTRPMPPGKPEIRVGIAPFPVDRLDPLLLHKTTRRDHLDQAVPPGLDELILLNNLGHVTEGTVRALLVKLHGQWLAPPLEDGLLPSLWRDREMAATGAREQSLTVADLVEAEEICMGNSVRGSEKVGWLQVE